jgi:hypothetical protein
MKIASLSLSDWTRLAAFFVDSACERTRIVRLQRLIIVPPFFLKASIFLSKSCVFEESEVGLLVSGTGSFGALGSVDELMLSIPVRYTVCQSITRYV